MTQEEQRRGVGRPKCKACLVDLEKQYAAVGLYGWQSNSGPVKADLCADHAAMLRRTCKVVCLRSYRKRATATLTPRPRVAR